MKDVTYTPVLGGQQHADFPLQFPGAKVTRISLATTIIEQLSNDGADKFVTHGSGFFWRANGDVYLISARHVLTGRDPFLNRIMSSKGFLPSRLVIHPAVEITPGQFLRVRLVIDYDPSDPGTLLQDPQFETLRTDIAALRVRDDRHIQCLNDHDIDQPQFTAIGMECSIVGYPQKSVGGLMTPVWRRATIASEPALPIDNKPMFLLDASTSPGLSGAPVFRRHIGPLPIEETDGSVTVLADRVVTTTFVGVYAGRLMHRHFGGEVPFVFYGNRLQFIFS